MQTLSIEIVHPKAQRLLADLVDLDLIRMKPRTLSFRRKLKALDFVETHLASEYVLAKEWLNPKEDEAWRNL